MISDSPHFTFEELLINCFVKMKTSIIILFLLVFNATAIFAEPISQLVSGINTWILVVIEAVLGLGYWIINIVKDLNKAFEIEFNEIRFYPVEKQRE